MNSPIDVEMIKPELHSRHWVMMHDFVYPEGTFFAVQEEMVNFLGFTLRYYIVCDGSTPLSELPPLTYEEAICELECRYAKRTECFHEIEASSLMEVLV